MSRKILITGTGQGKTFMAELLAHHCWAAGVSHAVFHVGSRLEAERCVSNGVDFLIFVSNDPSAVEQPWRTITVAGGQIDGVAE